MAKIHTFLNVSEDKIRTMVRYGKVFHHVHDLGNICGVEDVGKAVGCLEEDEVFEVIGDEKYVTESGAFKFVMAGQNIRAIEARKNLCEVVLPQVPIDMFG